MAVLSEGQIEQLHRATLRVLETIGVRIEHAGACRDLRRAGCAVDGVQVRMPAGLVKEMLQQVPGPFRLYGSRGGHEVEVGGAQLLAMTLGGAPNVYEPHLARWRPATSDDVARAALVVDWADQIHLYAALFGQADVPGPLIEANEYAVTIRHLTKPFNASIYTPAGVRMVTEMAAVVVGGLEALKKRPTVLYSICPLSPLRYTASVTEAIVTVARFGLPLSIVPLPVFGVSAPITLAGALVQQNAELIAGLVLAYRYQPGLPVMANSLISSVDMRSGLVQWGSPDVGLAGACAAQLARRYHLPIKVYGFGTGAKALDIQNGVERGMNALMAALAGPSMLGGLGSTANLLNGCLEQLVIDNEIMARIARYRSAVVVDEETLALEGLRQAMEGVDFMAQRHTVRHMRAGALWQPSLSDISSQEDAQQPGFSTLAERSHEQVRQILERHRVEPLPAGVEAEIERLIVQGRALLTG